MQKLVVYFSSSGNTRKVAKVLAKKLKADLDEIKEYKKRGAIGMMIACRLAMKKKTSKITFSKNPKKYDLVVLGGPVWAWNLIPPLRAYLEQNKDKIKKLGFFLTYGGNLGKSFEQVEEMKKTIATMEIVDKQIKSNKFDKEVKEFVKKLK